MDYGNNKTIKRILSLALAFLLTFSFGLPVTAYGDVKPVVSVVSAEGEQGGTATVNINIDENPGFAGFQIVMKYDATKLEFVDSPENKKDYMPLGGTLIINKRDEGTINFNYMNLLPCTLSGNIVGVVFNVKNDARGKADVSIEVEELLDSAVNEISRDVLNGTVTVTKGGVEVKPPVVNVTTPQALTVKADDDCNSSLDSLMAYVGENAAVDVVYEGGETGVEKAVWTTTDEFDPKGGHYNFIAKIDNMPVELDVNVLNVEARFEMPELDDIIKIQNPAGFNTYAELGITEKVAVEYYCNNNKLRVVEENILWTTIPQGFGKEPAVQLFEGVVDLPTWATVTSPSAMKTDVSVSIIKKEIVEVSTPSAIKLDADDSANLSGDALKAYLNSYVKLNVVFNDGEKGSVNVDWNTTDIFSIKGGSYNYKAEIGGTVVPLIVNVTPVEAEPVMPVYEDIIELYAKSSGYTTYEEIGLAEKADVRYYYADKEKKAQEAISWTRIPDGFGTEASEITFEGKLNLPDWATVTTSAGLKTSASVKVIEDKAKYSLTGTIPSAVDLGQDITIPKDFAVLVKYDSGREEVIPVTQGMLIGYDKYAIGEDSIGVKTITINIANAKLTFEIMVNDVITGLYVLPPTKLEYKKGDTMFDLTGGKVYALKQSENKDLSADLTVDMLSVTDEILKTAGSYAVDVTFAGVTEEGCFTIIVKSSSSSGSGGGSSTSKPAKKEEVNAADVSDEIMGKVKEAAAQISAEICGNVVKVELDDKSKGGFTTEKIDFGDLGDSSAPTVVVRINDDGSITPVLASLEIKDGKLTAKVNVNKGGLFAAISLPDVRFGDVSRDKWYFDSVSDICRSLIMEGMGDGRFAPESSLTSAQTDTILLRMLGIEIPKAEKDAQWYESIVKLAEQYGITGMKDAPDSVMNRSKTAVKIMQAFVAAGNDTNLSSDEIESILRSFDDVDNLSSVERHALAFCVKLNIYLGKSATSLAPKDNLTRAEMAALASRIADALSK